MLILFLFSELCRKSIQLLGSYFSQLSFSFISGGLLNVRCNVSIPYYIYSCSTFLLLAYYEDTISIVIKVLMPVRGN